MSRLPFLCTIFATTKLSNNFFVPPRIVPGTIWLLGTCDDHCTTKNHGLMQKNLLSLVQFYVTKMFN